MGLYHNEKVRNMPIKVEFSFKFINILEDQKIESKKIRKEYMRV